jgi:glycerate kinase
MAWTRTIETPAVLEGSCLEMIHDVRNSLTAMKAAVQLGLHNPAESASHARLETIEREITWMEELLFREASMALGIEDDAGAAGAAA